MLPEIFSGILENDGIHADVLADLEPAEFVQRWRSEARQSARDGRVCLAHVREGELAGSWRLTGSDALHEDGRRVEAESLAGLATFALSSGPDSSDSLAQALWGDARFHLEEEADVEDRLSQTRFRAIFRLRGLRGVGLEDLCNRFGWDNLVSLAPAEQVIREAIDHVKSGDLALFSDDSLWTVVPEHLQAEVTSCENYCRSRAAQVHFDVDDCIEIICVALRGGRVEFREALLAVDRLQQVADGIAPGNYVAEHEGLVRTACLQQSATAEALQGHPALQLQYAPGVLRTDGLSLRPLISLSMIPAGLLVSIPQLGGECYQHLVQHDGTLEQARDGALVCWAAEMAAAGKSAAEITEQLHPYTVPDNWPLVVARQGETQWSVRPLFKDSLIWYQGCVLNPYAAWEFLGEPCETYEMALLNLVRSGQFVPGLIEDEQLRKWTFNCLAAFGEKISGSH